MPIGSIVGGLIGSGGANAAAGGMGAAVGNAMANTKSAITSNKSLASPYLAGGYAATNALLKALGLGHLTNMNQNPESDQYGFSQLDNSNVATDRTNALTDFQASPGYNWRVGQGVQALDRSAAAKGMVLSGAQGKAVQDYGQNQGSQEWGNYINQLFGLSGQGSSSANATNAADTSASNNGTNALIGGTAAQGKFLTEGAEDLGSGISKGLANALALGAYGGSGGGFGLPNFGTNSTVRAARI